MRAQQARAPAGPGPIPAEPQPAAPAAAAPAADTVRRALGNQAVQRLAVQAKLAVGRATDPLEREADQVAEVVVRRSAPAATDDGGGGGSCPCHGGGTGPPGTVWRCRSARGAGEHAGLPVGPGVQAGLEATRGAGRPLPGAARSFFEQRFHHDFGDVRVHTGADAADLSDRLGARAFTWGRDVYFGAGRLDPGSPGGRRLLAHELTHTLQQRQAGPRPALLQRDDTEEETDESRPPGALLSVSLSGLRFTPLEGSTYRPGIKLNQAVALAVLRLVGEAYRPGMAEQFLASVRGRDIELEYTASLDDEAQAGEEFLPFLLYGSIPFHLVTWIEQGGAGAGVALQLTAEQRDLVVLGLGAQNLWNALDEVADALGAELPAWYSREIFFNQVASRAGLLRKFMTAYDDHEREPSEDHRNEMLGVGAEMVTSLLGGAEVLEAVRVDKRLVDHEVYAVIWPTPEAGQEGTGAQPRPKRTRIAAQTDPVDARAASFFLTFLRTQPALTRDALEDSDRRRELLNRFANYIERSHGGEGTGDQDISEEPGRLASDPPHPALMSVHPQLEAPFFDAALRTDHTFTMQIQFPSVFDAFATYSYRFDRIQIPDDKVIGKAATGEKAAEKAVAVEDLPEGERPSWSSIYGSRMARDSRYLAEDVVTVWEEFEQEWGAAGGTVALAAIGGLLRYVGTSISTIFEILTEPQYQAHFEFPGEGLFIVRCRAIPRNPDEAEVTRPPSVAWVPVFAVDPVIMAERRVQQTVAIEEASRRRLRELDEQLESSPVPGEDRERLEKERRGLQASLGTVEKAVAFQKTELEVELAKLEKAILGGVDRDSDAGRNLLRFHPRAVEAQRYRKQIKELEEIAKLRKDRGLKVTERITATFVSDRGQVMRLLLEAVNRTPAGLQSPQTWYVSDATTKDSGAEQVTAADRTTAILGAIEAILKGPLGYGRGQVSVLLDGTTHSVRIKASAGKLLTEALDNLALIAAIAAIVAAPFTGGASLSLLIPIGVIGIIPSAYRIASRLEAETFRWDLQTAMDIVNIAGSAAGLGQVAAGTRAVMLGKAAMITGFGADGLGMVLLGADLMDQLRALKELPPGLREARRLEIIGGALLNAGIMIGGSLASKRYLRDVEAAAARGEDSYAKWRRGLDDKSRAVLEGNESLRETFAAMRPDVRALLTHCGSSCIPPNATEPQSKQLQQLIDDLGLKETADDWHRLRAWLHRNRAGLDAAIDKLKGVRTTKALDRLLRGTRGLDDVDVALQDYSDKPGQGLRSDPEARRLVQELLGGGQLTLAQLAAIMQQTKIHATGGVNMLKYLEALTKHRPKGYERVLSELMKGLEFFTGAEWVLRYIHRADLWEYVRAFEVEAEPGGRRWDAKLATMDMEFKNWGEFWRETFLRQFLEDYVQSGGFRTRQIRWVFDPRIGTTAQVRGWAEAALESARGRREGFTNPVVDACLAALKTIIIVPAPF